MLVIRLFRFIVTCYRSLIFNLKLLPFNQAMKFPFWLTQRVKLHKSSGQIIFKTPIKPKMFTFITIHSEIFGIRDSHLTLEGDLILTGDKIRIATGTSIMVYKDAKLTIGEDVTIGGNSKVFSQFKVTLEKGLRTAWEVQIIDTNFHFTKNLKTGVVHNAVGEIIVGEHSWIANRATLAKGTVLPPKTVVANNSYVNKTFNLGINQKSLVLAGMPAKVVGQDLVRLKLSGEEEKKIRDSFN